MVIFVLIIAKLFVMTINKQAFHEELLCSFFLATLSLTKLDVLSISIFQFSNG